MQRGWHQLQGLLPSPERTLLQLMGWARGRLGGRSFPELSIQSLEETMRGRTGALSALTLENDCFVDKAFEGLGRNLKRHLMQESFCQSILLSEPPPLSNNA